MHYCCSIWMFFVYHTHTLGIQNSFGCTAYLGILCIPGHTFHLVRFGIDISGVHFHLGFRLCLYS